MIKEGLSKEQISKNIWKLYAGALLGGFAFFYNAIDTLYYRHFGLTFQQIGWIISASLIATLVLEVPSGAFADLYGKKKALVIAAISNFLATGLVALGGNFPIFLLGFVFWGVGRAFNSSASSAILFDSLKALDKEKDFLKHTGRISSFFISIDVISSLLAPLLFAIQVRLPYFVSLGAAFLVILIQLRLREVLVLQKQAEKVLAESFQQIVAGFRSAFKSNIFVWLTLFNVLIFTTGKVFAEMVSTPFLINYVGYTLKNLSLILCVGSLMQASFVFFADKLEHRLGDRRSFLLIIIVSPLATLAYSFSRNLVLTAILIGIYYSTWSFGEVVIKNYINHNISDNRRATILSISSMLVSAFALVGLPLLGAITDKISLQNTLILLAVTVATLGLLLINQYRGRKQATENNLIIDR